MVSVDLDDSRESGAEDDRCAGVSVLTDEWLERKVLLDGERLF